MSIVDQLNWELIVNLLIKPPRRPYSYTDLGPSRFDINGIQVVRQDLELTNARGHVLQCSHFVPDVRVGGIPCIVYHHGSGGCRLDALEALELCMLNRIALFCFDSSGCGLSDGDYVTLGHHEMEDLKVVTAHLAASPSTNCIGLWGRSMGAVACLLYEAECVSAHTRMAMGECTDLPPVPVNCLVLDSPFASLSRVAWEVVQKSKYFEGMVVRVVLTGITAMLMRVLRSSIASRADFDINEVEPLRVAHQCRAPVVFLCARSDELIEPQHGFDLFERYGGDAKKVLMVEGRHNTHRSAPAYAHVGRLLVETLKPESPSPLTEVFGSPTTRNADREFLVRRVPAEWMGGASHSSHKHAPASVWPPVFLVLEILPGALRLYRTYTRDLLLHVQFDDVEDCWHSGDMLFLFSIKRTKFTASCLERYKALTKSNQSQHSASQNRDGDAGRAARPRNGSASPANCKETPGPACLHSASPESDVYTLEYLRAFATHKTDQTFTVALCSSETHLIRAAFCSEYYSWASVFYKEFYANVDVSSLCPSAAASGIKPPTDAL